MNWSNGPMAIVRRPKLTGLGEHVGVLQPDGNVFHTADGTGPEIVSFAQFAAGMPVELVERIAPSEQPHTLTRIQYELLRQRPYDLLSNNCEIVANRVAGKPIESRQVKFWSTLVALAGLAVLVRST
ncbi:NC domain protein [Massilia sp. SR12]